MVTFKSYSPVSKRFKSFVGVSEIAPKTSNQAKPVPNRVVVDRNSDRRARDSRYSSSASASQFSVTLAGVRIRSRPCRLGSTWRHQDLERVCRTPIRLEQIDSLWWNEGIGTQNAAHDANQISEATPLEDTEESTNARLLQRSLPNNIQLYEIARSADVNDLVDRTALLRNQLNDAARATQTVHLEEQFVELRQRYVNASDAVRASVLRDLQRGIETLDKEQHNIDNIQDPPSMRGRRTYGRGRSRLQTGAEVADKELRDLQREAEQEARRQGGHADQEARHDENQSVTTSRRPVVITFNALGEMIQHSQLGSRKRQHEPTIRSVSSRKRTMMASSQFITDPSQVLTHSTHPEDVS